MQNNTATMEEILENKNLEEKVEKKKKKKRNGLL